MPTIRLENVSKLYKAKKKDDYVGKRITVAVDDVSLTVEQGEFVFITGSSGAGKSTLLQLMAGKCKPDRGKVYLNNSNLFRLMLLSRNRASLLFGQVWQDQSLIRKITVEENLLLAARLSRKALESKRHMYQRIEKVLGLVGMSGVGKRYPGELSIGECRRVELARALINSPPILILDEITANLDEDNIWDIFHLLMEINRRGTTVIMATHASQFVNIMRRRVVTLVDGRLFGDVQKGRYGDIM